MRLLSMLIMLMVSLTYTLIAFAQEVAFPIPEGDITALLLNLATNYKTMGAMGVIAILTLLTVQAIKAWVEDSWQYKRLLTLAVSIVYSIIAGLIIPGSNAATVLVTVFISSGGASALYEALKGAGIIKKKKIA